MSILLIAQPLIWGLLCVPSIHFLSFPLLLSPFLLHAVAIDPARAGAGSCPFLGISWPNGHLGSCRANPSWCLWPCWSAPAEVQTRPGCGPFAAGGGGRRSPGPSLAVGNEKVSVFSRAFSSCASPTTAFSYRKAPPPIPPGTKAKPLISVTAQSSTESAHESYLPGEVARSPAWSKDAAARCNSAESLESSKVTAVSLDLPPVQPRAAPKPSTLIIKAIPGREELRSLARQRKWRPSIGVQVGFAPLPGFEPQIPVCPSCVGDAERLLHVPWLLVCPHGGPNATPVPAGSPLLSQGCTLLLLVLHTEAPEVWGCPAHSPSVPGRLRPSPTRTRRAGARGSSTPSGCRWRKTKGTEGPGRAVPRALRRALPSSPGRGFPPLQSFTSPWFLPQHLLPLSSQLIPPELSTILILGWLPPYGAGSGLRTHTPLLQRDSPGKGLSCSHTVLGAPLLGSALGLEPGPGPGETSAFFCKKNVIFRLGWERCEPHSL